MNGFPAVGCLQVSEETRAATWLPPRMHAEPLDVCTLVPTGFDCYLRVFHPAHEHLPGSDPATRPVSWSELAVRSGRAAHAGMQWDFIRPSQFQGDEPPLGTMSSELAPRVVAALAPHTRTPVWFGMWAGRHPLLIPADAPTFSLPLRTMHLLRGPLAGLVQNLAPEPLESLPTMAWPEDRSWVLATDADLRESYLAANRQAASAVLASENLETAAVSPEQRVTTESDTRDPG